MKIKLDQPAEKCFTIFLDGRRISLVERYPYTRVDGVLSSVTVWICECQNCKELFHDTAGAVDVPSRNICGSCKGRPPPDDLNHRVLETIKRYSPVSREAILGVHSSVNQWLVDSTISNLVADSKAHQLDGTMIAHTNPDVS